MGLLVYIFMRRSHKARRLAGCKSQFSPHIKRCHRYLDELPLWYAYTNDASGGGAARGSPLLPVGGDMRELPQGSGYLAQTAMYTRARKARLAAVDKLLGLIEAHIF